MPINSKKYVAIDSQDTPIVRYVVVEKPASIKRYGVDISDIFGDVDANGNLMSPVGRNTPDFSAVTGEIGQGALMGKFYGSGIIGNVVINATSVENYACLWAFRNSGIEGIECPRLDTCGSNSFEYAFAYSSIKDAKFGNLTGVGNSCFSNAFVRSSLETASFDELEIVNKETVFKSAFYRTNLGENPFPKLKEVSGLSAFYSAFGYCNNIKTFDFDKLEVIAGVSVFSYAFENCGNLETLSFSALKTVGANNNIFNKMLYGCSGVTVHFPSNMQSVIGSWLDVTDGFGGTNTTVLFDLPATE